MNIRVIDQAASEDDIKTLIRVRLDFLKDLPPFPPLEELAALADTLKRYYREHLGKNFWALVLEDGCQLAGAAFLIVYGRPANPAVPNGVWGEVNNVFTYPQYRGRGLATDMMRRLIELAGERGVSRLDLSATEAGRAVYEKLGFTEDAGQTRMQLRLRACT